MLFLCGIASYAKLVLPFCYREHSLYTVFYGLNILQGYEHQILGIKLDFKFYFLSHKKKLALFYIVY